MEWNDIMINVDMDYVDSEGTSTEEYSNPSDLDLENYF